MYYRGHSLIKDDKGNNFLHNAHGDVTQLTNASGNVTKNYNYDVFGSELNKADNDTNPFRYCGEYFDSSSGTYYLRNRYYSPQTGRFTSEDPIRAGSNYYTYCGNNPLKWIDPSGLTPIEIRDFTNANGGTVTWNEKTSTATFKIGNKTLTTLSSGKNGHGLDIWNNKGSMTAQDVDLYKYFGIDRPTNWGITEKVVNLVFNQDKSQGVWTSPVDAIQKYAGYNSIYDSAFGLVCDENLFISKFKYGGQSWMVEGWKGNYLNMGVGAEIGVYQLDGGVLGRIGSGQYWPVSGSDMLYMQYYMYNRSPGAVADDLLFRRAGTHWWLNGFRPGIGVIDAKYINLQGSITFKDPEMAGAFVAGLQPSKAGTFNVTGINGSIVNFNWQ